MPPPDQFKAWRKSLSLTQQAAADALGISRGSVELYEAGKRRDDGRPVEIPRAVELACAALAAGVTEYCGPAEVSPAGSPALLRPTAPA